jgi:rubrerythrin
MSMLDWLRTLVDPVAQRAIAEDRRRKVEAPLSAPRNPSLSCRVCGYEGEGRFCPRCLADTMGPRRRR